MSAFCSKNHPTKVDVFCNRAALKPHPEHSAYCWDEGKYVSWTNDEYQPNSVQRQAQKRRENNEVQASQRRKIRDIAGRIQAANRRESSSSKNTS